MNLYAYDFRTEKIHEIPTNSKMVVTTKEDEAGPGVAFVPKGCLLVQAHNYELARHRVISFLYDQMVSQLAAQKSVNNRDVVVSDPGDEVEPIKSLKYDLLHIN